MFIAPLASLLSPTDAFWELRHPSRWHTDISLNPSHRCGDREERRDKRRKEEERKGHCQFWCLKTPTRGGGWGVALTLRKKRRTHLNSLVLPHIQNPFMPYGLLTSCNKVSHPHFNLCSYLHKSTM